MIDDGIRVSIIMKDSIGVVIDITAPTTLACSRRKTSTALDPPSLLLSRFAAGTNYVTHVTRQINMGLRGRGCL